jgi:hypothetical protein
MHCVTNLPRSGPFLISKPTVSNPQTINHRARNRFDRRGVGLIVDAFVLPGRPFPFCSPPSCSSGGPRFRDERVACCDGSRGPGSRFAAFAAPLVTRPVEISVKFESVVATGCPAEEAEISVLGGQVDGSMTVIGSGSINRGSIFAMSKSREEAGVSVPCRVSDSVDASLDGPPLGLNCRILGR